MAGLSSQSAAGAAQRASGSLSGRPRQRKKILLAMEKWTHTKNNKKITKKHNFFRKTQKNKEPRDNSHRMCPPGRPRRPPGAKKKATRYGEMDAHKKSRKILKKPRFFQKHQKTRIWSWVLPRKASKKRGPGEGPNRIWLRIPCFFE